MLKKGGKLAMRDESHSLLLMQNVCPGFVCFVEENLFLQVNGKAVQKESHDAVAAAIREGCKLPSPVVEKKLEEEIDRSRGSSISSEEEVKLVRLAVVTYICKNGFLFLICSPPCHV